MKCWLLSALLLCVTSLATPMAWAYVEIPYITPAHPTPDAPISVHVGAGWCHAFTDFPNEAELVLVAPGQLRLMTDGIALSAGHPFCIYLPYTYRFDIGTLPAGSYTLQVFIYDEFSAPVPIGFGSVSFVVAAPATIPSTSLSTLVAIAACLLAGAMLTLARSNRG